MEPFRAFLGSGVEAVSGHHENYDGTGYPPGWPAIESRLAARIVHVADSFEVMTAVRSYKRPMKAVEARQELARNSGSQFDPAVVRALLNVSLGRLHWSLGVAAWMAEVPFSPSSPGRRHRSGSGRHPDRLHERAFGVAAISLGSMVAPSTLAPAPVSAAALSGSRAVATAPAPSGGGGGAFVGTGSDQAVAYLDLPDQRPRWHRCRRRERRPPGGATGTDMSAATSAPASPVPDDADSMTATATPSSATAKDVTGETATPIASSPPPLVAAPTTPIATTTTVPLEAAPAPTPMAGSGDPVRWWPDRPPP